MYGTSDRIGHRTIQRKSPSSEENLYVRKKTRKVSEENCIGYGTPCADPRNHKSMSFTERGDQAAGILRQHDTQGVLPIPAFLCSENSDFAFWT